MAVCVQCSADLPPENDYVTCSGCKNKFHYGCANVRETAWRKYSADVKLTWKCLICKVKTTTDTAKSLANSDNNLNSSDVPGAGNNITDSNPTTSTTITGGTSFSEIEYLRELLRHKDMIIGNQIDLIHSLKEQLILLKSNNAFNLEAPPGKSIVSSHGPVSVDSYKNALKASLPSCRVDETQKNKKGLENNRKAVRKEAGGTSGGLGGGITNHDLHEALARAKLSNVINLANGDFEAENYRKVNKSRKTSHTVVGKKIDDGRCSLRAAESYSYWHVYRLHPDTKKEELEIYLQTEFPGVQVEGLQSSSPTQYSSFKVTVKESEEQKILDPGLWPSGTRINRFFLPRRR